jgi:hypothetical protein
MMMMMMAVSSLARIVGRSEFSKKECVECMDKCFLLGQLEAPDQQMAQ